jgi:L-ribulose-5-phosphate 3-epimerase UlaE
MSRVARRAFLTTLGAGLAAPAILRAQTRSRRLPLCFSTYGCPKWPWKTILEAADRLGYAAIEIRVIEDDEDLPRRPEFTGARLKESRRDLDALGIKLVNLGSGVRLHEKDPQTRARHLDDGRRFIDLARALDVPYIRVFPDRFVEGEPPSETLARIVDGGRTLAEYARAAASRCSWSRMARSFAQATSRRSSRESAPRSSPSSGTRTIPSWPARTHRT